MKSPTRILATVVAATVLTAIAFAQSAQDPHDRTPFIPIGKEPPAQLTVDTPNPRALAIDVALIQYRAENVHIVPISGPGTLNVFPRVGHVHITVDDLPWHWADTSNIGTIDIKELPPGLHKVRIDLVDGNNQRFPGQSKTVTFTAPGTAARSLARVVSATVLNVSTVAQSAHNVRGRTPVVGNEPPAQLTVDPPNPQALAAGAVLIQYRAENVHIIPVFGPAALKVSPRVGHVHINVDDLPWHWADASNTSTIDIQDLPPGQHTVRIDLVDGNHQLFPGQSKTVTFTVPGITAQSQPDPLP
jgi:hypothetical protein